MKEHTDRMDKSIKDKFEDHEVPVPSHLWNSIESNLPSENNNSGGNFFFNKPFILSILVISTVIIGTYLYKKTDTQHNPTHPITHVTAVTAGSTDHTSAQATNNSSNAIEVDKHSEKGSSHTATVSAQTHSENISSESSFKNNKNTNSKNNVEPVPGSVSYRTEAKNNSSNKVSQSVSNTNNQYIAATGKNTTTAGSTTKSKTGVQSATTRTASNSTDNVHSSTSPSSQLNHTTSQPNKLTTPSTNEDLNSTNSTHSNAISSPQSTDPLNAANEVSLSKDNNTTGSINASHVQDMSKNTADNKLQKTVYADSIKLFTSALMDSDQLNNHTVASGTSANNNTILNNNTTNNTLAKNQSPDATLSQISGALHSLNTANTLSTPYDAVSLHTKENHTNTTATVANSIDQTASGVKPTYTAINNNSIGSNNNTVFSNTGYADSNVTNNENAFTHATNNATNEALIKIDSTINVKEIDSVTSENLAKTKDLKTFDTQKKKSLFLSRCSFDGYVTPSFGYMHLSSNNPEDSLNNFKERNKNANTGFGLTTGLRMNYALSQKVEIGFGLQYSSLSQQSSFTQHHFDSSYYQYQTHTRIDSTYDSINHVMIYTPYTVRDSTYIAFFTDQVTTHTDKFQNISIPIHIAYGYSISKKFSLLARTSLLINYQTYSVTYLNTSNEIIGYHSNKNLSLGGSFSIGGYYQFSKACAVFAEPILSYYFQNVFDNQAPFKQTQLMLGLQTGIRLSF